MIELSPMPYEIFQAIKNAKNPIGYDELVKITKNTRDNLSCHISRLLKQDIIAPLGNHKNRTFKSNVDPADVILVQKVKQNKPKPRTQKRPCITCRELMDSTGFNHRICNNCKSSKRYQRASNKYTPDDWGDSSGLSDLMVGFY
ncbi:hypothetical protein [Kiloniella litopenaei]|uniref:hypothetical protein n=1 Tax=Kiloniella litopenaei TaxID=1549748 RepID=UPI003BA8C565